MKLLERRQGTWLRVLENHAERMGSCDIINWKFLASVKELNQQGRFKEAGDIYTRTMAEVTKSDLDADNCLLVAEINENYAKVLDKLGSARRAMALVLETLEIRKRVPKFELSCLFKGYILLTLQHIALGRLRAAQISQETAEKILEKSVSRSSYETAELDHHTRLLS